MDKDDKLAMARRKVCSFPILWAIMKVGFLGGFLVAEEVSGQELTTVSSPQGQWSCSVHSYAVF
jgi:hypothetical protein